MIPSANEGKLYLAILADSIPLFTQAPQVLTENLPDSRVGTKMWEI
jgi:hypothetical protein